MVDFAGTANIICYTGFTVQRIASGLVAGHRCATICPSPARVTDTANVVVQRLTTSAMARARLIITGLCCGASRTGDASPSETDMVARLNLTRGSILDHYSNSIFLFGS